MLVGSLGGCGSRHRTSDDDGLPGCAFVHRGQGERTHIGGGVVGGVFLAKADRSRRTHYAGKFLRLLAQGKSVLDRIPAHVAGAQSGGPLQREITDERGFHLYWFFGLDIKDDDSTMFCNGNKKRFLNL